jgi:NADPH:quinone reductase-like Zn-dependent oxidoreductase
MSDSRRIELRSPGFDGIHLAEGPIPEPGEGEVLLRMGGSCLNYHDMTVVRGIIPNLSYPLVPLSDGCGEVAAVGPGVSRVAVGDHVMPNFFPHWLEGRPTPKAKRLILGDSADGCCGQHRVFGAECLVRVPKHLSMSEAATLPCAALTAWSAIREAGLGAGDLVVIQGTGGVSLFGLQLAKALGASVVLTSSSDEKLERARELGADYTLNYREQPEWSQFVREVSDGRGADLVIDVGGPGTLAQSILAVRMDGCVAVIGVLTGFAAAEIPVALTMTRNIGLKGITVGSRKDFETMCELMERAKLRPVISDTFPMQALAEAIEHLEAGKHFGKIAIALDE